MRITRELLQKVAEDTVAERVKKDPTIVAAYLHGTVLEGGDPVMGGTADIDLVFIHQEFDREREIIRMTEDVHLDIEHHSKESYQPPKELRQRPWMGNTVFACKAIYDPEHFVDFTQAGVRSLFHNYENVLARSQTLYDRARATWLRFHNQATVFGPEQVQTYLQALEDSCNAVACLFGPPIGGRRYMSHFEALADGIGQSDLYDTLVKLLAGNVVKIGQRNVEELKAWMLQWEEDFQRLNTNYEVPPDLHIHRHAYYMRAFEEMLGSDAPETILWPLLRTWTMMSETMPSQSGAWQKVVEKLGLVGPDFQKHLDGLDEFLDRIEVLIEEWEPEGG